MSSSKFKEKSSKGMDGWSCPNADDRELVFVDQQLSLKTTFPVFILDSVKVNPI
jgi:hypothetical protein